VGLDGDVVAGAGVGFAASDEEGLAEAGGVGGGDVGAAVADHDGVGEIEVEVGGGLEDHSGGRLAEGVVLAELGWAVVGVVGGVVDGVDLDGFFLELVADVGHEGFKVLRGVEAASDAGLVGDDDDAVAEGLGGTAEGEDAVDEVEVLDAVELSPFFVDDAVTVEE